MSNLQLNKPIIPCLWCKDNALDKVKYYCSIFPNSKILIEHPVIINFELNGNRFQALNGGNEFEYNESISFNITCQDQAEVDHYWNRFVNDGGKPLDCTWCQDKYGMRWQIVPERLYEFIRDPDPVKVEKVMRAIMKMQKIIITDIEAAYNS
jgi:predicted 3-demethylubiquinone-9 3-methyltransferase (glyoxalase superfamily)